eukprot:5365267-Alexandrium_andersonii.AAC.1
MAALGGGAPFASLAQASPGANGPALGAMRAWWPTSAQLDAASAIAPRLGPAQRRGRARRAPVFDCSWQLRLAVVTGAPRRPIALSGALPL